MRLNTNMCFFPFAENEKPAPAIQIKSRPSKSDKLLSFLEGQQKALDDRRKEEMELKERALQQQKDQGSQLVQLMTQLAQVSTCKFLSDAGNKLFHFFDIECSETSWMKVIVNFVGCST